MAVTTTKLAEIMCKLNGFIDLQRREATAMAAQHKMRTLMAANITHRLRVLHGAQRPISLPPSTATITHHAPDTTNANAQLLQLL